MMYTYSKVHCARWANPEHTAIDCIVKFDVAKIELPFNAIENDQAPHGREIFARLVRGDFGPIAPFVPSYIDAELAQAQFATEVSPLRAELDRLIAIVNEENATNDSRGIVQTFGPYVEKTSGKLLQVSGVAPAKQFGTRISQLRTGNFIDAGEADILNNIRLVRNAFAHHWDTSFENSEFRREVLPHLQFLFQFASPFFHLQEDLMSLVRFGFGPSCGLVCLRMLARCESSGSKDLARCAPAP